MLTTMYTTGILVATLFLAAALGDGDPGTPPQQQPQPQPQPGTDHTTTGAATSQSTALVPIAGANDNQPPLQMSEFCFFGKYPSATCRFRCHLMTMEAYCDESRPTGEGMCKCRQEIPIDTSEAAPQDVFQKPETPMEEHKPAGEEKTSFTIPIHTAVQEPEEDQKKHHVVFYIFDVNKIFGPTRNATKTEGSQTEEAASAVAAGWSFQHLLALLIVLLLLILIVLELYACYKKQKAKSNDMETIFKNIPMPNKV